MTSIGNTLRNARESQQRTLSDVAQELCITQGYLTAIEQGEVENLPGLFFYKNFARQYAALLGLDESLIRPQLERLSAAEDSSPREDVGVAGPWVDKAKRLVPDMPLGWSVAGLAAVLVLCSGFYSWWTRAPEQRIPQPSVAVQSVARAPRPVASPPITTSAAVPTTEAVNSAPQALSGIVLKLSATERTWLSVSSGGKEIFSGFLQPSESKILSGLDITTMRVGNAAGIDVHWNGKSIGPLGTRGQVLTIRFTPEDFEIVPPKEQL
jgi:cytoskeletal protein RodZ